MVQPLYIDFNEVADKKCAQDDFFHKSAFMARNVPVVCEIIDGLIEKLKVDREKEELFDGETETFLFQLKYLIHSVEQDAMNLHKSMINAGHKDLLYYQD